MGTRILASSLVLGAMISQAHGAERWQPITKADASKPAPAAVQPKLGKPVIASNIPVQAPELGRPAGKPVVHQSGYVVRGAEPENILHAPRVVDSVMSGTPMAPGMDWGCQPCVGPHGPWGRWYGRAEALIWSIKDAETPPLVTTSPQTSFGILGEPGTTVLFGGDIDTGSHYGGRFTLGKWCDPCERNAIEGSFFFLGDKTTDFSASSPGNPLLARPFFNVNEGIQDSQLIANLAPPGFIPLSGSVNVTLESQLMGAELNWRKNLCFGVTPRHCMDYHVDALIGFRWTRFEENLGITENLLVPNSSEQFGGFGFVVNDRFTAENNFFGGQLGLDAELRKGRWFFNIRPKVAIGVNHQTVSISGSTQFSGPGVPTTVANGGLYALSSNIGDYDRNRFSVIPELGFNLGYQVTDHLRVYVGYNVMFWFNVARPGQQIDTGINTTLLPGSGEPVAGPLRPVFQFNDSSFWAQGVNFGFELRY